jgi:predicted permease
LKEEAGRAGGGRRRRLANALVVVQVALSMVLLSTAGLSLRSMWNAHRIDPGFDAKGVIAASLNPGLRGYSDAQMAALYRELQFRLASLPRVESVTVASHVPLSFEINSESLAAVGNELPDERDWPEVDAASVGPRYFETMRISVLRGREFSARDTAEAPRVAIVNEALAKSFWPGEDAVGKKVRFGQKDQPWDVVGIVRNGKYRTLGEAARPFIYRPLAQGRMGSDVVLVRTTGDLLPALAAVRREVRLLDEKIPIAGLMPLEEKISVALLLPRAGATFFGIFGLLGLALAAVGLYGVISISASQRAHEMGIRMALGASRLQILRLVVGQGLLLTAAGLLLGLVVALGLTRAITVLLYGISPADPVTYVAIGAVLLGVAFAACLVPARRAANVDPMHALRFE